MYSFKGAPDAANPASTLIFDASGALYGSAAGGDPACGCGAVFMLAPSASGYVESVLHRFHGLSARDGAFPSGPVFGTDGALYGTTESGGLACSVDSSSGCGTIFRLVLRSGKYREDVVHRFDGKDGALPGGLTTGPGKGMFGITGTRVPCSPKGICGRVYALVPPRSLATVARHVAGGGLTVDKKGVIYGIASDGGAYDRGYVWRLVPEGSQYTYQIVYDFGAASENDGRTPSGGLLVDPSGSIFGVTNGGGTNNYGTVYELTPVHGMYHETILHSFGGFVDGANPVSGLIEDGDGNLYGAMPYGGSSDACYPKSPDTGCGIVYEMVRGSSGYSKTTIYQFEGAPDGSSPWGELVFDASGALYGTTMTGGAAGPPQCPFFSEQPGCGTVFKLTPSSRAASAPCSNCVPSPAHQALRRRQPV